MIFLLVIISILFFRTCLTIKGQPTIVDFTKPVSEIVVWDETSIIEFVCLSQCRWIIHERIRDNNQITLTGNNLSLVIGKNRDIDGNITVCKSSSQDSNIEYYNMPRCCPCCNWYNQQLCDGFPIRSVDCVTIIIYSFNAKENLILKSYYEDSLFLLPCKLPSSGFSRLVIQGKIHEVTIFYDSHKTNESLDESISYSPSTGLCLNTSKFGSISPFLCSYSKNHSIAYSLRKIYMKFKKVDSSLYFIDESTDKRVRIPEQNPTKLLINQTVILECQAKYIGKPSKLLMCMRFDLETEIQKKDFHCEEDLNGVSISLTVNTNTLRNLSKVICDIQSPSRTNPKQSELQFHLFDKKRFEILNEQDWNNKTMSIKKDDENVILKILFDSIPASSLVTCQMLQIKGNKLPVSCSVSVVGECACIVDGDALFQIKKYYNISVLIHNELMRKQLSMLLKPIYIETPKVIGLTQILEGYKKINCKSDSSEPYEVQWEMEYDNQPKVIHYSNDKNLIIPLNDSIESICALCLISNEVGQESSQKTCQKLIDIDIKPHLSTQLFLLNVTIWNSKSKRVETINQITQTNLSTTILDLEPVVFLCGSRNKSQKMNIYFKDVLMNTTELITKYSKQVILKLYPKTNENRDYSGTYSCLESNSSHKSKTRSVIQIRVNRTITPKINVKFENDELKTGFRVGLDLRLYVDIFSFPPSKVDVYSTNSKDLANLTKLSLIIIHDIVDRTHSKVKIIFTNLTQVDSMKYMIVAHNIAGKDSYVFSLEASNSHQLKIYYILAGSLAILVVAFGILIRFFHKSGYAVPIIQIPNSMYKSLDVDSVQLINNIWFDPLERKRWTITPSSRIKILKEIGSGNYGKIYKGIFIGNGSPSEQLVALKQPILTKQSAKGKVTGSMQFCQVSLDCFINEIRVLSKLTDCPNIIKMYGCVVFFNGVEQEMHIKEPTTLLVLEYYTNRSLNEFLIKNSLMFSPYTKFRKLTESNGYAGMKMDEGITLLDLKKISLGIATGLEYLSGLNIIHRDIATRNILIDEHKSPKICDFGLAIELENEVGMSSMYQILTHQKALPFKILPPEVLELKSFCLESDIWSFGLLLWQMFNLEQENLFPQYDNPTNLLKYIRSRLLESEVKELLPVPKYADESMWQLIRKCWAFEPFNRPSSQKLKLELTEIVRNSPVEVIRVSSDNQSERHEGTYRDSIGSSKFPSTRTSIITLNYPSSLPFTNSSSQNSYFFDEFSNETLIDEESPL